MRKDELNLSEKKREFAIKFGRKKNAPKLRRPTTWTHGDMKESYSERQWHSEHKRGLVPDMMLRSKHIGFLYKFVVDTKHDDYLRRHTQQERFEKLLQMRRHAFSERSKSVDHDILPTISSERYPHEKGSEKEREREREREFQEALRQKLIEQRKKEMEDRVIELNRLDAERQRE